MENEQHPHFSNGKICYLEIPALDITLSSRFYAAVFGWHIRTRDSGEIAFDDAVGEVSGTWVLGRKPATEEGFIIHIMVDSISATLELLVAHGGEIIRPQEDISMAEKIARFADPAGNILGLYQQ